MQMTRDRNAQDLRTALKQILQAFADMAARQPFRISAHGTRGVDPIDGVQRSVTFAQLLARHPSRFIVEIQEWSAVTNP